MGEGERKRERESERNKKNGMEGVTDKLALIWVVLRARLRIWTPNSLYCAMSMSSYGSFVCKELREGGRE